MPTYPSPKPTICPKWELSVNVGLGEGQVYSFPDLAICAYLLTERLFFLFRSICWQLLSLAFWYFGHSPLKVYDLRNSC